MSALFTTLILTLLLSLPAPARQCNLSHFTRAQLNVLTKARQLNRFKGKVWKDYDVEILYSDKLQRSVVLVGEIHEKRYRGHKLGLEIIEQFRLFYFEMIPYEEAHIVGAPENLEKKRAVDVLGVNYLKDKLLINPFKKNQKSLIYSLATGSLQLEMVLDTESVFREIFYNPQQMAADLNREFASDPELDKVSLPLEMGELFTVEFNLDYFLHKRDRRMARTLEIYTQENWGLGIPVAIVGKAHLPGIMGHLAKGPLQLQKCENF